MWRLALYLVALAAGVVAAQGLLYFPLYWVARLFTPRPSLQAWLLLAGTFAAQALILRAIERRPIDDVGLGRRAARPYLFALGAGIGAGAIGIPCALLLAGGELRAVAAPAGSWLAAAGSLAVYLAPAALWEELLVRGYPLLVLTEALGAPAAVLATSVVFGALHLMNPNASLASAAVVTLAGVFLAAVRFATGSLWAAFAAHLAWNWTLAAAVHAAVSGLPFAAPDYRVVDAGPDWLTGGAWGPEGGAAAVAGMLAASALLLRVAPNKPHTLAALFRGPGRRPSET